MITNTIDEKITQAPVSLIMSQVICAEAKVFYIQLNSLLDRNKINSTKDILRHCFLDDALYLKLMQELATHGWVHNENRSFKETFLIDDEFALNLSAWNLS